MNHGAVESFAQDFLGGIFGTATVPGMFVSSLPELSDRLTRYNALVRASTRQGRNLAIALSGSDVNRMVSLYRGRDAAENSSIAGENPAEIDSVFGSLLENACTALKERRGVHLEIETFEVLPCGPDIAAGLRQFLGAEGYGFDFRFSFCEGHEGFGALMFSSGVIGALIPQASAQGENSVAESIGQDEIEGLLEGGEVPIEQDKSDSAGTVSPKNMEMVLDIRLTATARLGRVEMPIGDILGLGPGSIIEVGHLVDEPVELLVNDKLIARGDVVVVDEKFGLRITEIISTRERIESLR